MPKPDLKDILLAINKGRSDEALMLVTSKPELVFATDPTDQFGIGTILHTASYKGDYRCAKFAINIEIDLNKLDLTRSTALQWAVRQNHYHIAEQLIVAGALTVSCAGEPLCTAVSTGNKAVIKLLTDSGLNVNVRDSLSRTPIMYLRNYRTSDSFDFENWIDIFGTLVAHGADVNGKDESGSTLLHGLLRKQSVDDLDYDLLKRLLDGGVEPDITDQYGVTPLHILIKHCSKGGIEISDLLLEKGASIESKDKDGLSPLFYAVENYENHLFLFWLIKNGANLKETEKFGKSVLHHIIGLCRKENAPLDRVASVINLLLNAGADVNIKDHNGDSPLFAALELSESSRIVVMVILLAKGADANARNKKFQSPLHKVIHDAKQDTLAAMRLLINHGADIDARDADGNTPLILAVNSKFSG